jgi:hypothetical protein
VLKFSASSRSNKESILSSPENKSHKRVRPAKTKDIRPFNPASEESKCLNVVMSENRLDKAKDMAGLTKALFPQGNLHNNDKNGVPMRQC